LNNYDEQTSLIQLPEDYLFIKDSLCSLFYWIQLPI